MRRIVDSRLELNPRFIEGTLPELEELFGSPLPELPEGYFGTTEGDPLLVDLFPGLRKGLRELIEFLYRGLSAKATAKEMAQLDGVGVDTPLTRFERVLETVLTAIIEQERRLGLLNLFWLAHAKDAAELLHEFFSQPGMKIHVKYQMHPLLQGTYRNAHARVWARLKSQRGNPLRRNLGGGFNTGLIDCLIDDQLPLTEISLARLNFAQVLVESNKRFRLTFREFRELFAACRDRLRDGIQRREPRLLDLLRRQVPSIRPEAYDEERAVTRILFNRAILAYLLSDFGGLGAKLLDNTVLKAAIATRRSWSDLLAEYQDLLQAVKRSEVVDLLRQRIGVVGQQHSEAQLRQRYDEGRLYRLYPETDMLRLARKITVIFADLRGFTQTSEGGVSERELTHQLYEVFDPLAAIVEQYRGRIDKFTGDGVMITFGSAGVGREDELNGLRTALAIRQMLTDLRTASRTGFEMGISVHTGRAQVAHFILDDRTMDRTVIGRNVNIAGRLSGSGQTQATAFEAEEWTGNGPAPAAHASAPQDVWVDPDGTLYNTGIVVSQDTVEELLARVDAQPLAGEAGRGHRFYDERLRKNVLLEYVGDARFKGVGRSIAIYRLGLEEGQPATLPRSDQERG